MTISQVIKLIWKILNSNALHNILFITLSIITIFVSIYFNVMPVSYKPNIHISTNYDNNEVIFIQEFNSVDFLVYIYNQGNGACVDMKLHYPEFLIPSLRPQSIFRQYTDIKGEIKANYSGGFLSSDNTWRMGILESNEVIVVDMRRRHDKIQLPSDFLIEVSCNNGEKQEIKIKNAKPFIVENPLP